MAARRKRNDVPEDVEDADAPKRRTMDTVAAASYVLRNRDRLVREVLGGLQAAQVLDGASADRIWNTYAASDSRTRQALQRLVARVVRIPLEQWDLESSPEAIELDVSKLSRRDLDRLKTVATANMDPTILGDRIRSIDMDKLVGDRMEDENVSLPIRLLGDVPVIGQKVKSRLRMLGALLVLLALAALAFPGYAQEILFYGLIALLALIGGYLLRASWKVDKAFQAYGIDVEALARLSPPERRLLMARRTAIVLFDPDRVADIWERVAHAVLPEAIVHDEPDHPHVRAADAAAQKKEAQRAAREAKRVAREAATKAKEEKAAAKAAKAAAKSAKKTDRKGTKGGGTAIKRKTTTRTAARKATTDAGSTTAKAAPPTPSKPKPKVKARVKGDDEHRRTPGGSS